MFEKTRDAFDVAGNKVLIVERQNSEYTVRNDGTIKYKLPARFFGPDGKQLIPEGKGFYRTAFGTRYHLAE